MVEEVSNMQNAKIFSVLDANQGFWIMKALSCAFKTLTGRYIFLHLMNIVDNILALVETIEEHDCRIKKLLQEQSQINAVSLFKV